MKPPVIHIGFGRAGSSLLQIWFAKHPQIALIEPRSIVRSGFLSEDEQPRLLVMSSELLSLGLRYDALSANVDAPIPVKTYRENVCRTLKALCPEARILVVTRGYEQFLLSIYSQYVKKGGVLCITDFLAKYKSLFLDILDVDHLLNLYVQAFGRDSIITMPYELLQDDYEAFFSILEDRLGVERFRIGRQKINPRLDEAQVKVFPLLSRLFRRAIKRLSVARQAQLIKCYNRTFLRSSVSVWLAGAAAGLLDRRRSAMLVGTCEYLDAFRGKASFLEDDVLFERYREAYLLGSQERGR